jgi:hypothetical protein
VACEMTPRGQRARDLLAELVRTWDHGFPAADRFSASFDTTLLIVDLANLVRQAREELATSRQETAR